MDKNKVIVDPGITKGTMSSLSREVYNFLWTEVQEAEERANLKIAKQSTSDDFVGVDESRTDAGKWMTHIQEKLAPVTVSDDLIMHKVKDVSGKVKQVKSARDMSQRVSKRSPGNTSTTRQLGDKSKDDLTIRQVAEGVRSTSTTHQLGDKSSDNLTARQIAERVRSNRYSIFTASGSAEKLPEPQLLAPKADGRSGKSLSHLDVPSQPAQVYSNISQNVSRLLHQLKKKDQQHANYFHMGKTAGKMAASQRRSMLQSLEQEMKRAQSLIKAGKFLLPDLMMSNTDAIISIPCKNLKDLQRDFQRRLIEANILKKVLKNRKRWLRAYTKLQTILYISKNMAERSLTLEMEPMTFVDIGDSCTTSIDYGAGRSIDAESYKRQAGIALSSTVKNILIISPQERSMVQQEQARREFQKVEVFSEFPINIQEKTISKAFYQEIGPKRVIVRQGHFPQFFYFVISGEAYIKEREYKETGEVTSKACGFVRMGMSFGGYALITGGERASSVISRTSMQLLYLNGEDYLDIFVYPKKASELLPDHIRFIRRNSIVTHDSRFCRNLFIIKYGYCKVFRKIDNKDEDQDDKRRKMTMKLAHLVENGGNVQDTTYIERDSGHVTFFEDGDAETQTPKGTPVRVPVTKLPRKRDKLQSVALQLPRRDLVFLPLAMVKEGEIFGFDQTSLCPRKNDSRATILVSLDAEVVAVDKEFFCRNCPKEAKEIIEKTFIYDDEFIERRLRQRCNRDVHLEEVLSHYFYRLKGGVGGRLHHQSTVTKVPTVRIVKAQD